MSDAHKTYTYRCGEKVELGKSPDQMVVRSLPEYLDDPNHKSMGSEPNKNDYRNISKLNDEQI